MGYGGRWQRGLTCLKSQPALVTGVLRFRFMECERLPKAMALRDVRVAWEAEREAGLASSLSCFPCHWPGEQRHLSGLTARGSPHAGRPRCESWMCESRAQLLKSDFFSYFLFSTNNPACLTVVGLLGFSWGESKIFHFTPGLPFCYCPFSLPLSSCFLEPIQLQVSCLYHHPLCILSVQHTTELGTWT